LPFWGRYPLRRLTNVSFGLANRDCEGGVGKIGEGDDGEKGEHTSETLVEGEKAFFSNDPCADLDKVRRFYLLQR
jgi:hypothetical protein